MAREEDRFQVTPELGQRLRELRLKAGLTQHQVAVLMGRKGKGGHTIVCRLERGGFPNPTVGQLADFLRACKARFTDISDILDQYTMQPDVVESKGTELVKRLVAGLPAKAAEAVSDYDLKSRIEPRFAGRMPEPADKRVLKVRKTAGAWLRSQRLEQELFDSLGRLGIGYSDVRRSGLTKHGRKVWGILNRTRTRPKDPGKREAKRNELLAEARSELARQGVLSVGEIEYVDRAVCGLHEEMELAGEHDRLPGQELAEHITLLPRHDRVKTVERMTGAELSARHMRHSGARFEFIESVWKEVEPMVSEAGAEPGQFATYHGLLRHCWHIGTKVGSGPEQRKEQFSAWVKEQERFRLDLELCQRIAGVLFKRFDAAKDSFPPDPNA
jgi:transcriptional regulator with XRE-family HTH domain